MPGLRFPRALPQVVLTACVDQKNPNALFIFAESSPHLSRDDHADYSWTSGRDPENGLNIQADTFYRIMRKTDTKFNSRKNENESNISNYIHE